MEYMTKVDGVFEYFYRSVVSYRPESDIKLLRFELSVGYPIYNIYQKDVQSNLFLDSIEAQRSEYGTQITIDMSKAGPITPIPNPK